MTTTSTKKNETLRHVMSGGNPMPPNSVPAPATSRKVGRPGPRKKVEDETIIELLRQGYSQSDISRTVKLSPQAISKRMKTLGHRAVAAMFHADSQLWGVELRTMTQLAELNGRLLTIARTKKAKSEEVVAAAREIRQQLDFQMRFQDALKVQQRFEEFRETVLQVLDELGQELGVDVRAKVMDAFKRRTETRLMLTKPKPRGAKTQDSEPLSPELMSKVVGPSQVEDADFKVVDGDEVEATVEDADLQESDDVVVAEEEDDDEGEDGGVDFDL